MYNVLNILDSLHSGYRAILPSDSIEITPMKRDRKKYFEENLSIYLLNEGFKKLIIISDDNQTNGSSLGEYQFLKPKTSKEICLEMEIETTINEIMERVIQLTHRVSVDKLCVIGCWNENLVVMGKASDEDKIRVGVYPNNEIKAGHHLISPKKTWA